MKPRLTPFGRIALIGALSVGLIATFWPARPSGTAQESSSCPLVGTLTLQTQKSRSRALRTACACTAWLAACGAAHHYLAQGFTSGERPGSSNPHEPVLAAPRSGLALWFNGTIWSGTDETNTVDALLVDTKQGVVVAAGSLPDVEAAAAAHSSAAGLVTKDLDGRFLMPGFIDPHVHLLAGGVMLTTTDLTTANSKEGFQQIVQEHVRELEEQEKDNPGSVLWVEGGNWDEGRWGGPVPDRHWLDPVTGTHRPALLRRLDAHMAVANTRALQLANITRDTPDPPNGIIDRDSEGEPTGVLRENAMGLVNKHIPPASQTRLMKALQSASEYALSRGVTSVLCLGRAPFTGNLETTWEDLEQVFLPAADAGQLSIRIMAFTPLQTWPRLQAFTVAHGPHHEGGMLHWGGLKAFADGSLGSRTALMWEPYTDHNTHSTPAIASADTGASEASGPPEYGTRMMSLSEIESLMQGADAAGLSVAIHAIGWFESTWRQSKDTHRDCDVSDDSACVTRVLRGPRHRIEHFQHMRSADSARVAAQFGVGATPNPQHLVADGAMMYDRLGDERAGPGRSYAFNTLLKAGLVSGMASDWPVADIYPMESVFTSVHRRAHTPSDSRVFSVEEGLSVGQALLTHTRDAAYVSNLEHLVGSLRPGMKADLVMLDTSPFDTLKPGSPLPQVVETYVNGRCVHGCKQTTATAAA